MKKARAPKRVKDLRGAEYNPSGMTDVELARLKESMERFGDLSGVIVNRRTGRMIGGHKRRVHMPKDAEIVVTHRLRVPNKQGTIGTGYVLLDGERWSYREVDVDPETEAAMNVSANQHHGSFDFVKLGEVLTTVEAAGFDHSLLGFDQEEWDDHLGRVPDFKSGSEDEQGQLDEKTPVSCPECGHQFVP